jgi:hypothetical protein
LSKFCFKLTEIDVHLNAPQLVLWISLLGMVILSELLAYVVVKTSHWTVPATHKSMNGSIVMVQPPSAICEKTIDLNESQKYYNTNLALYMGLREPSEYYFGSYRVKKKLWNSSSSSIVLFEYLEAFYTIFVSYSVLIQLLIAGRILVNFLFDAHGRFNPKFHMNIIA